MNDELAMKTIWTRYSSIPLPKWIAIMLSPALCDDVQRIEQCLCGAQRAIFDNDARDPWVSHRKDCDVFTPWEELTE